MRDKKPFSGLRYALAVANPLSKLIRCTDDRTGISYHAYKRDVVGRTLFRTGRYERILSDWLIDKFSDQGGNFIDIGANLGYFSCLLGKIAGPNSKILSIEPEPSNFYLLEKNLILNKLNHATPLRIALGETKGCAELNLYKNSNRGRHSIIAAGTGKSIQVPVHRLDDICNEHFDKNQPISFIKMDVEGYEPFVLKGGLNTLGRTRSMSIEFSPHILNSIPLEINSLLKNLRNNFSKAYIVGSESIKRIEFDKIKHQQDAIDLILEK